MIRNFVKRRGFTLTEILITVTIISILTSIGLTTYTNASKKSRDARRQADIQAVRSALELYRADNPATGYPTGVAYSGLSGSLVPGYLSELPVDPTNSGSYVYAYSSSLNTTYTLSADMEVSTAGYPDPYSVGPP